MERANVEERSRNGRALAIAELLRSGWTPQQVSEMVKAADRGEEPVHILARLQGHGAAALADNDEPASEND